MVAVRIPNSLAKPHRVFYQGRTYFPARRERRRYELSAREIKDLAMRTASQYDRALSVVEIAIHDPVRLESPQPVLIASLLPVFFENLAVRLNDVNVIAEVGRFDVTGNGAAPTRPSFTVDGLGRGGGGVTHSTLTFNHQGLLKVRAPLPARLRGHDGGTEFYPTAIDVYVRALVVGAQRLFESADLDSPALLGVSLFTNHPYAPKYRDDDNPQLVTRENHFFPIVTLGTLGTDADPEIRPLCDHIHQLFGQDRSPCFNRDNTYRGPR